MAVATLTRGYGYWIQSKSFFTNKDQSPQDWTWYVGQWRQDYWTESEYGACCVEYHVPQIDDRLLSRTITIPFSFYGQSGMCEVYAVLSTKAPDGETLDFRFGPSGGVISNTEKTSYEVQDIVLNFTIDDAVGISGKTIYLYLYHPNTGLGTNGKGSSIVTKSFSDGSLTYDAPYTVSVSTDEGANVTVNRTSSGTGATGVVSSGANIYYGDKLKITFSPKQNYKLLTTVVNGKHFTSGNTVDVTGDISVSATSQPLASNIGATSADIGSASSISIMPYVSTYIHTLKYEFGSLTGVIVEKTSLTSYAWTIPIEFYNQIPNAVSGVCKIICETYDGSTMLGTSYCNITVRASSDVCAPTVSGSVEDMNAQTVALTKNSAVLVKYLSDALCIISAEAKNGAIIVSMSINNRSVTNESPNVMYAATDIDRFVFVAVDSRGYSSEYIVTPQVIPYTKLTLNPIFSRRSMTSDEALVSFNGNFYNGSFDSVSNTLQIKYRYKLSSEPAYGSWIVIDPSNYSIGASRYYSNGSISLKNYEGNTSGFHYQKSYDFQIVATDGSGEITLCSVTVTDVLKRGEPVFDWGENDFNFNVDVRIFNTSLFDIFYPVGSVFTSTNDSIPQALSICGMTWEALTATDGDLYRWKRIT